MAAVVHGVTLADATDAATYTTASFTPANNDLLVAFAVVTATAAAGSMSDSLGGGWTAITTALKAASADKLWCFIRDDLSDGSALTVTMDVTGDNGTGCVLFVARVSGMTRTGSNGAAKQSAVQSNQPAITTPAPVFAAAALTGNPTLGFVSNATTPAALTPPTSWTEQADTGISAPVTGGEYVSRDSGFTGTTITWGSPSSSAFGDIIVELDTSAVADDTTTRLIDLQISINQPIIEPTWVIAY